MKGVKRAKDSVSDMRRVFNDCAILCNQIERLGQDVNCATYLTEVRYKFPREVLEEVARRERDKYGGKIREMKDLIEVIEDYILTQESISEEQPVERLERSFQVMQIEKPACSLCNKTNHKAVDCRTYGSREARKQQISKLKL